MLPRLRRRGYIEKKEELVEKCRNTAHSIVLSEDTNPYYVVWPLYALDLLDSLSGSEDVLHELEPLIDTWIRRADTVNDYTFHVGLLRLLHLAYKHLAGEKPHIGDRYREKLRKIYYVLSRANRIASYELAAALASLGLCEEVLGISSAILREELRKEVERLGGNTPPLSIAYLELTNDHSYAGTLAKRLGELIKRCEYEPQMCTLAALILSKRAEIITVNEIIHKLRIERLKKLINQFFRTLLKELMKEALQFITSIFISIAIISIVSLIHLILLRV